MPRPLDKEPLDADSNPLCLPPEDFPAPEVFAGRARFLPSWCGLLDYDPVRVSALDGSDVQVLERGQRILQIAASASGPLWTVLRVLSWHRNARRRNRPQAWTQLAPWR